MAPRPGIYDRPIRKNNLASFKAIHRPEFVETGRAQVLDFLYLDHRHICSSDLELWVLISAIGLGKVERGSYLFSYPRHALF